MQRDEIRLKKLSVGPWPTNCYVLECPETGESVIVDPAAEAERIVKEARSRVRYILFTHTHRDHIGALEAVRAATGAKVMMHSLEQDRLRTPADQYLDEGDSIAFGRRALRVLHTPGHSPGALCFLIGQCLIAGDTLFPGGPGHTRSPEDFLEVLRSITQKLYALPPDTIIHPGHGPDTTIGDSQAEYALFEARPRTPHLCGDVLWASS